MINLTGETSDIMGMLRIRLFVFLAALLIAVATGGCVEKTLMPAVKMLVERVVPHRVHTTTTSASGLPTVTITLTPQSPVPSLLKSYRIDYETSLGEALPGVAVPETPLEIYIPPDGSTDIEIPVYSLNLVELFALSPSNISPLKATIRLTIWDYNNNTIHRNATCLVYKPEG